MERIGTTSTRLKRLTVSFDVVRPFLIAGKHNHCYDVLIDAVPEDAVFLNVQHAWPNCIELLLYSASFEEVKQGDSIPLLEPKFKIEERHDNGNDHQDSEGHV